MISHVDPFIGVDGGGNCLPGPYLPNGLVRLSPDTLAPQSTNGYQSHRPIVRFSHTHLSGTGGLGRYGNIGVTPFSGPPRFTLDASERQDEHAACSYYRVTLRPAGIVAELTATARVGVHRYTFPDDGQANLLVDLGAVITPPYAGPQADPNGWEARSTGGTIAWLSPTELSGRGDYSGGWGHDRQYSVHVFIRFDRAPDHRLIADAHGLRQGHAAASGPLLKAVAGYARGSTVEMRVGISFVSIAKARASVDREAGS
ncbi:MAG: hypothetical protein H0W72_08420, partial [Planctomycetes bacterium]|nr:hypothetical protein [Planctomycetota bacterium]